MGARSRKAKTIRTAKDFDARRLAAALGSPKDGRLAINAWTLADIFHARNMQLAGGFALPARLAESMRTDDALAVAYKNRLAPQRCLPVKVEPAKGARAASIAGEAEALYGEKGVGLRVSTRADINGCLANHGVAIGYNVANVREDGSRIDLELRYWPLEFVRWDELARCFKTRVDPQTVHPGDIPTDPELGALGGGWEVPIIHGDGRWVIFSNHDDKPWTQDAAILSGCAVWARHAFAARDWSKSSLVHGNAKLMGELPQGVPLQTGEDNDSLSDEAAAFLELLKSLVGADAPVGIRPSGSKTEFIGPTGTNWQVFSELVLNGERSAARIYLGTDGILGAQGGAPGVDIGALFGVATTIVEGDLEAIERGVYEGTIVPWTALNFGDSSLAPMMKYQRPDADEDARLVGVAKRRKAFYEDLKAARESGCEVDQAFVDELAEEYKITAPRLKELASPDAAAPAAPAAAPIPLRSVPR